MTPDGPAAGPGQLIRLRVGATGGSLERPGRESPRNCKPTRTRASCVLVQGAAPVVRLADLRWDHGESLLELSVEFLEKLPERRRPNRHTHDERRRDAR